MSDERNAIIQEIIESHRSIFRAIGITTASIWVNLDLSMAQLKTLMMLQASDALPIGQIAEMLGVGQPTASHLVDRLVQAQLVARAEDPLDRRRTLAQLSPAGEELAERLRQLRFEPLRRWLSQLDDATLVALSDGLEALACVARTETTTAAGAS
jgi:MarR family transcriptional regulator, organic hydroperoxide resistance regulator